MSEKEEVKEAPDGTLEQGDFKMKKKPKKLVKTEPTTKVDLTKKEEETKQPEETKEVVQEIVEEKVEEKVEAKEEPVKEEEFTVINEITEEEAPKEKPVIKTPEPVVEKVDLPENIEKLVDFMKETGGTIEDYARLSRDYTNVDEDVLLREYYKQTKPHLDREEVDFILEDKFYFDPEEAEEREQKKKKLAYKEEIAKAKNFLEETKKKYYDEIKLRPGVTQEQQKAMDFFNRYNKEQEVAKQSHESFKTATKDYFTNDFKGFDFEVGEKKFRYGVKDANEVAEAQSDLTTFIKKFLNEDGTVSDPGAYHKAIYGARNIDTIASHFYEQGKSDAVKDITAKSKNISKDVRTEVPGDVFVNGFKVRAISGDTSSKLKINKIKK
tara:strand:- start:1920 stop:3065 length:1146 start_codon:yes stop_codon:yes gene_type:complete